MTTYWHIEPTLWPHCLFLDKYIWDENGFSISFQEAGGNCRSVTISFPVDLDGVRILFLHDSVEMNQRIYALMLQAGNVPPAPFLPAFIRDDADLIDQVRALSQYSNLEQAKFLQYTIITEDFWIDIVSDQAPKVTLQDTIS